DPTPTPTPTPVVKKFSNILPTVASGNRIASTVIRSVFASPDGKTIYAAVGNDASDNPGGLYIATKNLDGTYTFIKETFINSDLLATDVTGVTASSDGTVIYVTSDNDLTGTGRGLYAVGYGGGVFILHKSVPRNNLMSSVAVSSDLQNIAVGMYDTPALDPPPFTAATAGGLAISANGGTSYSSKVCSVMPGCSVNSVAMLSDGSIVYAAIGSPGPAVPFPATYGGTVSTCKTGGFFSVTKVAGVYNGYDTKLVTDGLVSNNAYSIAVSSDGNTVYVGTDSGLSIMYKAGGVYTFVNKTTANSALPSNIIYSIFSSADGKTAYLGTAAGLSIMTTNADSTYSFVNKAAADGLTGSIIYSVFAASDGSIYVGTEDGLFVLNP
ncbi:MAG: hypothetical protein WCQ53_06330, partial [bacterium]